MNYQPVSSSNPAVAVPTPAQREDLERELDGDIQKIEARIAGRTDKEGLTAFYGSSSIRLWDTLEQDLAPHSTINMGFGGASYDYGVAYFDRVFAQIKPERIVLYFGDNDVARGQTPAEIIGYMRKLLELIDKRFGDIRVAAVSVKPSPIRAPLMPLAREVNALLSREMEVDPNREYVDIVQYFLNAEGLPEKSFYVDDMLHFNATGYETWSSKLRAALFAD